MALRGASMLTCISAPCSGTVDRLPTGTFSGCWVHGEAFRVGTAIPSPWLGVRAFSSQCLLSFYFNLNTQPLHHQSCTPESGRGLRRQPALPPRMGVTRGISTTSSLFREQSFLCAAGETGEQSWVQVLKSLRGEGLSGASGFGLSKPPQTGLHMYQPELPAPTPLPHQCVKCNDLFKSKPIPPTPIRGLSKHCLPSASVQVAWITSST